MAVLLDKNTKVLVQGITGYQGLYHAYILYNFLNITKETFAKWSISNGSDGKRLNSGAEFTNHKNCPQLDNMVSKCPQSR